MSKPPGGKECWGEYGDRFGPEDRDPEECFTCPVAEHCFRVTVADAVVSTAANLGLIVDNLVARGELKQWDELKEQREPKH
jgi:hypothetical protein